MLTEEQLKAIKEKNLARPIEDLELSLAMAKALVRLRRTTLRGLTVLRECDLLDALDSDTSLSEADKTASIDELRFILGEMGLGLNPEGRFESFVTLRRCTRAAAQELGLRTEEVTSPEGIYVNLTIYLSDPEGSVRIREFNKSRELYDPVFATRRDADQGMVVVRQILRRAEELAADEE